MFFNFSIPLIRLLTYVFIMNMHNFLIQNIQKCKKQEKPKSSYNKPRSITIHAYVMGLLYLHEFKFNFWIQVIRIYQKIMFDILVAAGLYCNITWDDLSCWTYTKADKVASIPCPNYVYRFDPTGKRKRLSNVHYKISLKKVAYIKKMHQKNSTGGKKSTFKYT